MKRTAFILCLLLTAFQTSFAADKIQSKIDIINLNVNSGLASNEVTCIVQDNLGFMWFGTTNGLCRYDGYQFKTYRSDYLSPSFFVSNHILLMEKDVEGNLWIVTTKEFVKFNPVTGRTTPVNIDTYLLNKIKSLLITRKGEILIGTTVGIYKYSKEEDNFVFLKKLISGLYMKIREGLFGWGHGEVASLLSDWITLKLWNTGPPFLTSR